MQAAEEQNGDDSNALDGSSGGKITSVKKSETEVIEASVFALLPLDQDQIRTFSQAYGVQDVDAFLKALKRAEADIFSGRPLDLIDLIDYWTKFGKIANRAELIEFSITSKLDETDPEYGVVSWFVIIENRLITDQDWQFATSQPFNQ